MKKEREEDFEANLTGEELQEQENAKPRWFKRIRKGILTSTADKKETPEGNIYLCAKNVTITTALVVKSILTSYLMMAITPSFLTISKVKMHLALPI